MSKYILAIDQGTTGSTVALVDSKGQVRSKVNKEFEQIFPQPGWVEHRAEDIWNSIQECLVEIFSSQKVKPSEVAGIGITNQRETVLVWDKKTGEPVYNAIVWQCRRTAEHCRRLEKRGLQKMIRRRTGLVLDPYFSSTKLQWILQNISGVRLRAQNGDLCAGTMDSYLLWRLTGGKVHKTDVSNASRTQLMNIHRLEWDKDLLKIFSIPQEILPEIASSSEIFGHTKGLSQLPDGIPISGMAGDQQAALFGQTAFKPGMAKVTFGTGSFILMNSGPKIVTSKKGLLTTVAWQLGGGLNSQRSNGKASAKKTGVTYALEGGAFVCGAAVQWLRDGLKLISSSGEIEGLAREVEGTGGVEFVPALTGLGAPHWDPEARGLICGLTRGTKRAHIARATLEAMALQNADILMAMQKDLGKNLKGLRVDGGAAKNNLLMQLQSDYMGCKTHRPSNIETTSLGAAYLAGLGCGFWSGLDEIKKIWQVEKVFEPKLSKKAREERLKGWQMALKRTQLLDPKKKKAKKRQGS